MGIRDEMFRAKVLIFMVPLVLPIGQPPARATDATDTAVEVIDCAPRIDEAVLTPVIMQTTPTAVKKLDADSARLTAPVTE